jgi:hypothetical protein
MDREMMMMSDRAINHINAYYSTIVGVVSKLTFDLRIFFIYARMSDRRDALFIFFSRLNHVAVTSKK